MYIFIGFWFFGCSTKNTNVQYNCKFPVMCRYGSSICLSPSFLYSFLVILYKTHNFLYSSSSFLSTSLMDCFCLPIVLQRFRLNVRLPHHFNGQKPHHGNTISPFLDSMVDPVTRAVTYVAEMQVDNYQSMDKIKVI